MVINKLSNNNRFGLCVQRSFEFFVSIYYSVKLRCVIEMIANVGTVLGVLMILNYCFEQIPQAKDPNLDVVIPEVLQEDQGSSNDVGKGRVRSIT